MFEMKVYEQDYKLKLTATTELNKANDKQALLESLSDEEGEHRTTDKEREIKEMAACISDFEKFCDSRIGMDSCIDCKYYELCSSGNTGYAHAKLLSDNGYRKADEVRKETAKELLDKLLVISPHGYEQLKVFVRVREQEYGIEVD